MRSFEKGITSIIIVILIVEVIFSVLLPLRVEAISDIEKDSNEISIPKVYFEGDISNMTSKQDEREILLKYRSSQVNFNQYTKIKPQGTSSMGYEKKNYTINFYEDSSYTKKQKVDVGFEGWGAQSKYCLKANWIDKTHSRNIVTARIVADVQKKYAVFTNTPHYGTIDGFPVEIYINNKFLGLYTWNIPKDEWMWNLDSDNPNHIVLGGGEWTDSTHFKEEITTFEDSHWDVEVGPENQETIDKFNRIIRFVKDSSNEEFIRDFELYINKDAALNYMISLYLIEGTDNIAKNLMMVTYNGTVWYPSLYDLDTTFGTEWDGTLNSNWEYIPESYGSKLWLRMKECFPSEIANRWFELRRDIFTKENVLKEFNNFVNTIPVETYQKEAQRWGNIPGYGIDEIEEFLNFRIPYIDNIMIDTYNRNNIGTEVSIEYSTKEKTNKEVVATLKSNRTDTIVLKNGEVTYDNTYTFTENGTYTFEYQDWLGNNKQTIVASVDWIDKEAPVTDVTYSTTNPTNQKVIAIITTDKELQEVEGWMLSENKKTLTKEYEENIEEIVKVKDLLGNETEVGIVINNIDKIAPQVEVIYGEQEKENPLKYVQEVIIQSNEPLQEIEGWTLTDNKIEMTKIYEESVEENIEVKDIAGNITLTAIKVEMKEISKGDVNGDSQINASDFLTIVRYIAVDKSEEVKNKHPEWFLSGKALKIADVDNDGKVNLTDVLKIQRHIAATKSETVKQKHPDWILNII